MGIFARFLVFSRDPYSEYHVLLKKMSCPSQNQGNLLVFCFIEAYFVLKYATKD